MSAAGLRKGWKTAACLLLATGTFKYARPPMPKAAIWSPGKLEAAAPPVCLESVGGVVNGSRGLAPEQDMEMLFVCRSRKSSFMANTYVFPGGVIESADYSPQWQDLYHECCAPYKNPFSPILDLNQSDHPKLPLYNDIKNTPILGEVAYRICAIRETFEEAGILLARDKRQVAQLVDILPGSFPPAVKTLPAGVLSEWRRRVHDNADEFLTMCKELQCVPDIWSLIEWSDWLTPRNLHRRYDTVFYLCFCEEQPPSCPDDKEVVDSKWLSSVNAIQQFLSGELVLAPPQFAELNALQRFGSAPCLHSYALLESVQGGRSRMTPVRIMTKDNILLIPAAEVDIWSTDPSYFDNESRMLNTYPPRFTIEVSGEGATKASGVEVSFTGVNNCHKLNTSLSLPLVNKTSHDIGGLSRLSVAPMPVSVQLHGPRSYSVPAHLMLPQHYNYPGIFVPPNALISAGQQQDPNTPTDEEFERVVAEVVAKLRNNWNILQTFLGIPENMQAEFDQEPTLRRKVLKSLQAWRVLNHGNTTRSKLAACIRKTDPSLHAIAHKLENGELT